jgi:hypothetical protein
MEHTERKKTYAEVVAPDDERYPKIVCFPEEPVVENEPEPMPIVRPTKAPWSDNGHIVGERKFGPLVCNPTKKATVNVISPDLAAVIESVPTSVPEPPSSSPCVLL